MLTASHLCVINSSKEYYNDKNYCSHHRSSFRSDQEIFANLKKKLGFVPNLYAYYAHSDTALGDYLQFQQRQSTLRAKDLEVINLVTSEYNGCTYCQAAHIAIGKLNGFDDDQILEIRWGRASFDEQLDALAKFTLALVSNRGQVSEQAREDFFAAGYTQTTLVDVVLAIGTKTISNFLHNLTGFEVDFPAAPALAEVHAALN